MTATFDDVRRIALGLPETEEVIAWETEVTFRVRNKIFVMEQDRQAHASLKATPMLQADLVERDPQTFASAAYVGGSAGSTWTSPGSTSPSSSRSSAMPGGSRPQSGLPRPCPWTERRVQPRCCVAASGPSTLITASPDPDRTTTMCDASSVGLLSRWIARGAT